jgi:hypothetical protein
MISGVVTEIYKKIYETAEKKHHASKAEIENASHWYDKNYRERHGQLKVSCVDMRKPISLDDVYVAVQFLNQHAASRYRSSEEVEQAFRERNRRYFNSTSDERQNGTQAANDEQYLMLLGGPGVGKSTFLRKVGLEALKREHGNFIHECIPVFLELKRFTEDQIDIKGLITREFETCGYPHPDHLTNAALRSGKLLILLDGLDEVPTTHVHNVILKIGDFVDQYSQNRFIASCRIAAYKGGFRHFTEVEMADFDDTQIQTYIKNWFDSTPDEYRQQLHDDMETAKRCWEMLNTSEHSATKELARNPLLLTLLCTVYDRSQTLPRNRANLYEKALNVFLEEWAADKLVHQGASMNQYLDIADEKWMLSEIAAKNFEENRLFFSKNELITQIREFGEGNANTLETFNASKILDTILIDQGLLVERVSGSYSFSHLTFQEYLTANYIVGDTRSIQGLVNQHLHDERWREVFLLTAGLMREADDLLVAMEAEAAKSINTDRLKTLFQWARQITNPSDNQYGGLAKREFVINHFFLLRSLDKAHKTVKDKISLFQDFDRDFDFYVDLDSYLGLDSDLDRDLYKDLDPFQYHNLYEDLDFYLDCDPHNPDRGRDLDQYLTFYLHRDLYRGLRIDFYEPLCHDFYRYMDRNLLSFVLAEFGDRFNRELSVRVKLVERIEEMKIFKGIDFKRLFDQFNAQQEFIRAVSEDEVVKSPVKSIHDTWISILGITNDMLAISYKEMDNYIQYLRAVDLIVACKEAAGRVSPKVWQKIEGRLLAWETEESED